MESQLIQIERHISTIKANITILESAIDSLKDTGNVLSNEILASKKDIVNIKLDHNSNLGILNTDMEKLRQELHSMNKDVGSLSKSVEGIEKKLEGLSKNSLLEFTSELDIKKVVTIIVIITTIITSPGVFNSVLSNSQTSDEKLDRLIELLDDP